MRRKSQTITSIPKPDMARGENDFEERLIAKEFVLLFSQMAHMSFSSFKEAHEFSFRAGVASGRIRERSKQSEYGKASSTDIR